MKSHLQHLQITIILSSTCFLIIEQSLLVKMLQLKYNEACSIIFNNSMKSSSSNLSSIKELQDQQD